jgi:hypothetical protein
MSTSQCCISVPLTLFLSLSLSFHLSLSLSLSLAHLHSSPVQVVFVPASVTDETVCEAAKHRCRFRFPVLSYVHPNGAALCRCSQPARSVYLSLHLCFSVSLCHPCLSCLSLSWPRSARRPSTAAAFASLSSPMCIPTEQPSVAAHSQPGLCLSFSLSLCFCLSVSLSRVSVFVCVATKHRCRFRFLVHRNGETLCG